MALTICGNTISYIPDECEGINGKIIAVAFIDPCALPGANFQDCAWWTTEVANNRVQLIPYVNGSYDGGSHTTMEGFGATDEYVTGMMHTVTFADKTVESNCQFWNLLQRSAARFHFVFFTETHMFYSGAPVNVKRTMPITTDRKSLIVNNVTVTWSNPNVPCPQDIPANCPVLAQYNCP
jgi:hypothetical protein